MVVADPNVLEVYNRVLGLAVSIEVVENIDAVSVSPSSRVLHCLPVRCPVPVEPGHLQAFSAGYVLKTLEIATRGCLQGDFSGVVTAPVHKGIINDAGISFTGHTEFLARLSGVPKVVMMLLNRHMKVALATTHLPLRDVAEAITTEALSEVLTILLQDLQQKFGLSRPRVAVCGLNPHAGEGGVLGQEENTVITPVVRAFQARGFRVTGPWPADTLFTPPHLAGVDAVLAMYHDQGLAPLKYAGFGESVNMTLGLPFVRTSVDHGTALDIAGQGQANTGSLQAAIDLARRLGRRHAV